MCGSLDPYGLALELLSPDGKGPKACDYWLAPSEYYSSYSKLARMPLGRMWAILKRADEREVGNPGLIGFVAPNLAI